MSYIYEPNTDTYYLLDYITTHLGKTPNYKTIMEIGTGSGLIIKSMKCERKLATDVNLFALKTIRQNEKSRNSQRSDIPIQYCNRKPVQFYHKNEKYGTKKELDFEDEQFNRQEEHSHIQPDEKDEKSRSIKSLFTENNKEGEKPSQLTLIHSDLLSIIDDTHIDLLIFNTPYDESEEFSELACEHNPFNMNESETICSNGDVRNNNRPFIYNNGNQCHDCIVNDDTHFSNLSECRNKDSNQHERNKYLNKNEFGNELFYRDVKNTNNFKSHERNNHLKSYERKEQCSNQNSNELDENPLFVPIHNEMTEYECQCEICLIKYSLNNRQQSKNTTNSVINRFLSTITCKEFIILVHQKNKLVLPEGYIIKIDERNVYNEGLRIIHGIKKQSTRCEQL